VLNLMQIIRSLTQPASAFTTELNVILTFGMWFSYAYESMPFFLNLGFNKLFRSELKTLFRHYNEQDRWASSVSRRLTCVNPTPRR
jgi:hypothetical protein